jgi:hypothetical protein
MTTEIWHHQQTVADARAVMEDAGCRTVQAEVSHWSVTLSDIT